MSLLRQNIELTDIETPIDELDTSSVEDSIKEALQYHIRQITGISDFFRRSSETEDKDELLDKEIMLDRFTEINEDFNNDSELISKQSFLKLLNEHNDLLRDLKFKCLTNSVPEERTLDNIKFENNNLYTIENNKAITYEFTINGKIFIGYIYLRKNYDQSAFHIFNVIKKSGKAIRKPELIAIGKVDEIKDEIIKAIF